MHTIILIFFTRRNGQAPIHMATSGKKDVGRGKFYLSFYSLLNCLNFFLEVTIHYFYKIIITKLKIKKGKKINVNCPSGSIPSVIWAYILSLTVAILAQKRSELLSLMCPEH